MQFDIGSRVVLPDGSVGYVEEFAEDGLCRVRCLTPDNDLSCCSTWVEPKRLRDGTNIRPHPRSKAWKAEAAAVHAAIERAFSGGGVP